MEYRLSQKILWRIVSAILISIVLYIASLYSYLLFHSIAETYGVIISFCIFMIAWNARSYLENHYFLLIGVAYFFVGILDLAHTLTYKGMGVVPGYGVDPPTQLWIAARYLESLSLMIAPYFFKRSLKIPFVYAGYSLITAIILAAIFTGYFPQCFIEGSGLTFFKIVSEYIIISFFLISILLLTQNRHILDPHVTSLMIASLIFSSFTEISFTLYHDVYGLLNLIGHFLKIVSFYLVYRAIIFTGLVKPQMLLFRNLKLSKESLQRAHDELEDRVEERTKELRNTLKKLTVEIEERRKAEEALSLNAIQLETRNKELQEFTFIASHDLQEPLRKIQIFSDIIQKKIKGAMTKETKDYFSRMINAVKGMRTLITALLNYTRVSSVSGTIEKIDLHQNIYMALKNLGHTSEAEDIKITIKDLPIVEGNPILITQLFQNLIGNAIKFRPGNQILHINIFSDMKVSSHSHDKECHIFIQDNGIGFDPEYAERIFKPFERLNHSSDYDGTGMGLAICRKIMERHKGSIRAESTPSQGTVFIITLPLNQNGGLDSM